MRSMSELLEAGIIAPSVKDKVSNAYIERLSRAREVISGIGNMFDNVGQELQKSPEDLGSEDPLVGQMYLLASDANDMVVDLVKELDRLFKRYGVPQGRSAIVAERANKLAYYGK